MSRRSNRKEAGPNGDAPKKHISGVIQITRSGRAFLPWPEEPEKEDIEIQKEHLCGALNGDTVEVALTSLFPRPKGKVAKVLERAKEEFVATLRQAQGKLVAIPDDVKFYRPIRLSAESRYAEGEKVLVRLLSFTGTEDPTGTIIEHLGRAGEHRVEMNAIVLEHGFRVEFSEAVLNEAREIEKNHAATIAKEAPHRADFRDAVTFTIDPVDAKDFDDALSVLELPNGEIEIGVHIADATYFCVPGTAIDDEAKKRGTSVYLVDATIPMLPHELSGNVCSLKAGEDRLAFSAVFRMNAKGEVLSRKFEKSIIRSNKRFTYEEAQEILNKEKGEYVRELLILRSLARVLRSRRERDGAIDFGDNEVRFILDEQGKPLKVVRKERIETNLLIEEFMLLCNREVSEFVSKLAENVPEKNYIFLYRIHDEPKADRIEELATFVRAVGYDFAHPGRAGKKKKPSAKDIQKLLREIAGKPEEHLIRTATLRSMAKAIYSTKNIGHFGLSFKYYTQFTSPIRRYPDMLAHRILESHLNGKPITRSEYTHLEKMCLTASEQEAKAVDAERESIRYKQVEYMLGKVGQTFDATISGVTDWGLYVEDKESAAEGLVRVRSLGDDFYNYSQKEYALIGQRSKKKYALGDSLHVKLVAADLATRQLDFELAH
ncbi:MAG: ribonuclease R [Patescibacteria group bacterium]|nr:ribonuclease R [Patescibacteria group bacterium]